MAVLPRVPEVLAAKAFFADEPAEAARVEPSCDRATLAAMYAELAPRVQRFLRDLLGCPFLAADATQETFVRAFRRVDALPAGTRLVAWVFGVARHVSLEQRKALGRTARVIVKEPASGYDKVIDDAARTPEAELLDREALRVVAVALTRLPEERRAALLLRLDHGLSYDEIAQLMGWSLPKVKVEIHRAREVLRATLEEYRQEEVP